MNLPPTIVLRIIRTAVIAWVVVRVALLMVGVPTLIGLGLVVFVLLVGGVTWIDIGYSRERLLFANLGISPQVVMGVALLVAGVLEGTIGIALSSFFADFDFAARF